MENPLGKVILGGMATIATWKALGPQRQQQVIRFLDEVAMAAEQARLEQERRRNLMLPLPSAPVPSVLTGPAPSAEVLRYLLPPACQLPDSVSGKREIIPVAEPDTRWREVIIPPAVVPVLGKRGSGKSALGYRLLELFRWSLAPNIVGLPSQARRLLPEWIGVSPTLEELPHNSIALIDEAYLADTKST